MRVCAVPVLNAGYPVPEFSARVALGYRASAHFVEYGPEGGPTQVGLESRMSPNTPARARYLPDPAELTSFVRLPRRYFKRSLLPAEASGSSADCWALDRLPKLNATPLRVSSLKLRMVRVV